MKIYSYVIKYDTGFAPNPFWGFCTLAVCTPNHMGSKPAPSDWIIGTEPVAEGNKLVFAMQVDETLHFQDYFHDPRFEMKKPVKNGSPDQRCGDNIYYQDPAGEWQQYEQTSCHRDAEIRMKDLRHPYVFIAENFYYFGSGAVSIPLPFQSLIRRRQGVKGRHAPEVMEGFVEWLCSSFKPGVQGNPKALAKCSNDKGGCS